MSLSAAGLPPLVLAAHGSPHPAHRPAVEALRAAVASLGGEVRVGWIESDEPSLGLAAAAAAGPSAGRRTMGTGSPAVVVVPLLLAAGHHARVDLPRLLADVPGAGVAAVLGPHQLLAAAVGRRLSEAGAGSGAAVVLGAAGSSDPSARGQVEEVADLLSDVRGTPVLAAYATGPGLGVTAAAHRLAGSGRPVVVATYLLGPGVLADRVAAGAAEAGVPATAPLGTAPEVVALIHERWRETAAALVEPRVA